MNHLTANFPQYDYVVVNDGSRDETAAICQRNGYNLLNLPVNLGLAGTYTTANFIYLAVIFLLIVKMFHMSIKQSQLETKIKDLAQKIALDENERGKEAQTSVKKVVSQKNE